MLNKKGLKFNNRFYKYLCSSYDKENINCVFEKVDYSNFNSEKYRDFYIDFLSCNIKEKQNCKSMENKNDFRYIL